MEEVAAPFAKDISISIVSHSQIDLVVALLGDLEKHCKNSCFELVLTLNLDECLPFALNEFSFPIKLLRNAVPLGFGANHNQAFTHAVGRYFCVMNPDIRLNSNPFDALILNFDDSTVGVLAPLVLGESGAVEDSARYFPSPLKILCKVVGRCRGSDYEVNETPLYPDWVGGMFMLFHRTVFEKLRGFDERYFLYYEDVDICGRLSLLGYRALLCPQAQVIHHAQRSSHRSFKFFRLHLESMLRFFLSPVYWRLLLQKYLNKID